MTGTPLDQLRRELSASREGLLGAISGVSEQQFKRRLESTAEEGQPWCIAEVLTHLLMDEQLWASRISQALAEDGGSVQPSDRQEGAAKVRAGRIAPVPQIIHGLLAVRRDLERLLQAVELHEDGLRLRVLQPERGALSIEWMVRKVIDHENEHVAQIEALRLAMAADVAGR